MCFSFSKIPISVASFPFFSSHPQMTITWLPISFSFWMLVRSWAMLRSIFACHHSVRVLGSLKSLQFSCPCQKQPLTKITVLYLASTMSGLPGRFFWQTRNLNPWANRNRRTSSSGLVFLPLIRLMIRLRVASSKTSSIYLFF